MASGGGIGRPDKEFVLDTFSNVLFIKSYYDNRTTPKIRQSFFIYIDWPENLCYNGTRSIDEQTMNRILSDYSLSDDCIDFKNIKSYNVNIIFCDINNQIISGSFEMEIENECGDVYEITEGRFDARFRYF